MIDLLDFLIADEVCNFSSEDDKSSANNFIDLDQEKKYFSPLEEEQIEIGLIIKNCGE